MSAGTGLWHSETNFSPTDEVHFIQMWVVPDTASIDCGHQQVDVNDPLDAGRLVLSPRGRARLGDCHPTA